VKTKDLSFGAKARENQGFFGGGADQDRTGDLLNALAMQAQ